MLLPEEVTLKVHGGICSVQQSSLVIVDPTLDEKEDFKSSSFLDETLMDQCATFAFEHSFKSLGGSLAESQMRIGNLRIGVMLQKGFLVRIEQCADTIKRHSFQQDNAASVALEHQRAIPI